MKLVLRAVLIVACNLLLFIWFAGAFAAGTAREPVDPGISWSLMAYVVAAAMCLVGVGWFSKSWPFLETAFAVALLPWSVGLNNGGAVLFVKIYAVAVLISCGAQLLRRVVSGGTRG